MEIYEVEFFFKTQENAVIELESVKIANNDNAAKANAFVFPYKVFAKLQSYAYQKVGNNLSELHEGPISYYVEYYKEDTHVVWQAKVHLNNLTH